MLRRAADLALAFALIGCAGATSERPAPPPTEDPGPIELSVFALSDFHGWLLPRQLRSSPRFYGGIAHIGASMRAAVPEERSIILDNGDMWTGPVESTMLKGEPVVAAYNALGVAAANIANHEFDFGLEVLEQRAKEATFPFLAANVREVEGGGSPSFLEQWTVVERAGVKVGVLGLSFRDTPRTTLARHVRGLRFDDYEETARREIPQMLAAGADVIVVLLHDVPSVGRELVESLAGSVPIHLVVVGQDHRPSSERVGPVPVVNPGPFGASYARFDLRIDRESRAVQAVDARVVEVGGDRDAPPHPPLLALEQIAADAKSRTDALAGETLGRLGQPLPVGDFEQSPLGQFIVDAWMTALVDQIDAAMLNHGAIRQPLGQGPVTLGDITSVMPFENNVFLVELTGAQLSSQLTIDHPVVAGFTWTFRQGKAGREVVTVVDDRGEPIDPERRYRVAILDFMYGGGDGFTFSTLDPDPVDSGLSWRDPVIRSLRRAEQSGRTLSPRMGPRARRVR